MAIPVSARSRQGLRFAVGVIAAVISLKVCDLVMGRFLNRGLEATNRSIVLREYRPNLDVWVPAPNALKTRAQHREEKCRVRTDDNGFIIGEDDVSGSTGGSVGIVFLGGSTTECLYVDEASRFPYRVGSLLRRPTGQRFRTLNAGFSGSNTMHALLLWLSKGIPTRAPFAVLMENINDLSQLAKTGSYHVAPTSRAIIQTTATDPPGRGFLKATKNLLSPNLWSLFRAWRWDAIDEWAGLRKSAPAFDRRALLEKYRTSLESFVHLVRLSGSEPILMTQFSRLRTDDALVRTAYQSSSPTMPYEDFVQMHAEFNDAVRSVAQSERITLIDLARAVEPSDTYIYDAVHLNKAGSERVAGLISQVLAERYPDRFSYRVAR